MQTNRALVSPNWLASSSVVARGLIVVGVPPVLVAGIYGMNFVHMPELHWYLGYPFALLLMAVTGLLPVIWFKWRGWM